MAGPENNPNPNNQDRRVNQARPFDATQVASYIQEIGSGLDAAAQALEVGNHGAAQEALDRAMDLFNWVRVNYGVTNPGERIAIPGNYLVNRESIILKIKAAKLKEEAQIRTVITALEQGNQQDIQDLIIYYRDTNNQQGLLNLILAVPNNSRNTVNSILISLGMAAPGLEQAEPEVEAPRGMEFDAALQELATFLANLDDERTLRGDAAVNLDLDAYIVRMRESLGNWSPEQRREILNIVRQIRNALAQPLTAEVPTRRQPEVQGNQEITQLEPFVQLQNQITEYTRLLDESARSSNLANFDPRRDRTPTAANPDEQLPAEIPLAELQRQLQFCIKILPERSADILLNAQIQKLQDTLFAKAKNTVNRMKKHAENIDKNAHDEWIASSENVQFASNVTALEEATLDDSTLDADITALQNLSTEITAADRALPPQLSLAERTQLADQFEDEDFDFLSQNQRKTFTVLQQRIEKEIARRNARKGELTSRTDRELEFRNKIDDVNTKLAIAKEAAFSIDTETDQVTISFKPVRDSLRELEGLLLPGLEAELNEIRRNIDTGEFYQRSKAFFAAHESIESIEKGASAVSADAEKVIKNRIFVVMEGLIASMKQYGSPEAIVKEHEQHLKVLKEQNGAWLSVSFIWGDGGKAEFLYGNEQGSRKITPHYNTSDHGMTGGTVRDLINGGTELKGLPGCNALLHQRRRYVRKDVARAIGTTVLEDGDVTQSTVPGNSEVVAVDYPETAGAWIYDVLDQYFEMTKSDFDGGFLPISDKTATPGGKNFEPSSSAFETVTKNGMTIEIARNVLIMDIVDPDTGVVAHERYVVPKSVVEGGKDATSIIHKNHNAVIDYILNLETQRAAKLGLSKPRFDRNFVRRTFRAYLLSTWNHFALASSTVEGLSCTNTYAHLWPQYAVKERDQGVARYNPLSTVFIFGYKNFSPWQLFGKNIATEVEKVLRSNDAYDDYEYLLHSFISLADTSTRPKKKHQTVFSPPLRIISAGEVPVQGRMKSMRFGEQNDGRILTLDDVKDIYGNRLYPVMDLERVGQYFATFSGFGKNALTVVDKVLMTDIKAWDSSTLLTELRKDAKYAGIFFPVVGKEIEEKGGEKIILHHKDSKGNHEETTVFLDFMDRFASYIVLLKALMLVMPAQFYEGGSKSLHSVESYLQSERGRNVISEHTQHVIYKIIEKLFGAKVFRRELGEEILKEFSKFAQFQV